MIVEVKTANGIYKVRIPTGRIGAIHMSILMQMDMPSGNPEEWDAEQKRAFLRSSAEVFREWAEKVLPHIIVDGPVPYEEMPGEDQYVIFLQLVQHIKMPEELFQSVR